MSESTQKVSESETVNSQDGVPSPDDISIKELFTVYPRSCFPTSLKAPSSKSKVIKSSEFEHILDNYDNETNMIAFRTTAKRISYWVQAFWIYLSDFIGNQKQYEVNWVNSPRNENNQLQISCKQL